MKSKTVLSVTSAMSLVASLACIATPARAGVKNAVDPNGRFNYSLKDQRIFTVVETRPLQCDAGTGQCTSKTIG
jgi:hypothetical protein